MLPMPLHLAALPGTTELLIILVIILVLFGGAKLPELARNLGKAKREFSSASREAKTALAASGPGADDELIRAANAMGIPTEGRTTEEIKADLRKRLEA